MTFYVNGRSYETNARVVVFEHLTDLAGLGRNVLMTYFVRITEATGTLEAGDVIGISDGLTIEVVPRNV